MFGAFGPAVSAQAIGKEVAGLSLPVRHSPRFGIPVAKTISK